MMLRRLVVLVAAALQLAACDALTGSGSDIAVRPDTATVFPGDALALYAYTKSEPSVQAEWSSSDPAIAEVTTVQTTKFGTTHGVLVPLAPGLVTITAKIRGGSATSTRTYPVHLPPACENDCWALRALMPEGRTSFGMAVIDGLVYVLSQTSGPTVGIYDPVTDQWDSVSTDPPFRPVPTVRAVGLDGILYRVTSVEGSTVVDALDPASLEWTTLVPLLAPRLGAGVTSLDGFLYAVGGFTRNASGPATQVATVERYDPQMDTWSARAPMSTIRGAVELVVANGRLYAIGAGAGGRAFEAYDPGNDTWVVLPPPPTPRGGYGVAAIDGIVYLVGGRIGAAFTSLVEAFDPASGTWSRKADVPVARSGLGLVAVGGRLFAMGGTTGIDPSYGELGYPRPTILPRANYMYTP